MQTLNRPRRSRAGFSLAELMVVIVILGLLATIVVPNVFKYLFQANTTVVKSDISQIANAIDSYMMQNGGKAPESLDILEQKDDNGNAYLKKIPNDPWDHPYVYEPPVGTTDYVVISYGKDGAPGGEGQDEDISNVSILERKK
jgi:general secretion pathway protein G